MDFSRLPVDEKHQQLVADVRSFLAEHVTDEVREEVRRTGEWCNVEVHLALGARGWIMPMWSKERGGAGLDATGARILELELARGEAPVGTLTTRTVAPAVERFAVPDLAAEILPKVADGSVRFCLGYTEPQGGSDIASARIRASRDGEDHWIISGTKVFTSSAQVSQYVFLLSRTDPAQPKHKGLTMFLVPLDTPGIEIQPIHTYGGRRTNTVYYSDVRISDRYRLGEVNAGWSVLRGPLDEEHSVGEHGKDLTLEDSSASVWFVRALGRALEASIDWACRSILPEGGRPIDDPIIRYRLGQIAIDIEGAFVTPGPMGRVRCSDVLTHGAAELMDLVGPGSVLAQSTPDALVDGVVEYTHRLAQGSGTQGGTVEVFRTMIASQILGLPRAKYPGSRNLVT